MYRTATRLACVTPGWGFHVPLGVAITDTSDVEYRTKHTTYRIAKFESVDTAVAISNKGDTALIQTLLTKWDFVLSLKSEDYSTYQTRLKEFVNHKAHLHGTIKHPTVKEYLGSLLRNTSNPSVREQPPHYVDPYDLEETKVLPAQLDDYLYVDAIPKDLLLGYWQSWGLGPLEYYAWDAEKRQVYSVDLTEALSGVCTRFELTTPAGCMACPMRGDCLNHLSGGQLNSSGSPQITLGSLQRLLKSKLANYIPPTLGDVGFARCLDKLNYSNLNVGNTEHVTHVLKQHSHRQSVLRDARKFYEENCSQCARNSICGSSGIITRDNWGQSPELALLTNKDHCFHGRGPIEVTEKTFPVVVQELLTLICQNYRGCYKYQPGLFDLRNSIQAAANEIVDWVFSAAKLDRYASACLRAELHPTTSVLPKPVMLALESLGLKGGYSAPTYYYAHNLTGLHWLRDVSSSVADCLPGITPPTSDWVVCTTTGQHILKSTSSQWSLWSGSYGNPGGEIAQFVDASLYTQVKGLDTHSKPLRRFSKVSERMVLCLGAIYKYTSPTREVHYGPFGAKRELAPLSAGWYGQWHQPSLTDFLRGKDTASELVKLILEGIATTPAKYSRIQLERISSLGRKSPDGKTKTQSINGKSSGS
jgi:hypothetical protein